MFPPPLYSSVKYGYPTLLSSFFLLLSHVKSKSFNWSESPSIPGFCALFFFFFSLHGDVVPLFMKYLSTLSSCLGL